MEKFSSLLKEERIFQDTRGKMDLAFFVQRKILNCSARRARIEIVKFFTAFIPLCFLHSETPNAKKACKMREEGADIPRPFYTRKERGKMDCNSLGVSTVGSARYYSSIRLLNNSQIRRLRGTNSLSLGEGPRERVILLDRCWHVVD